MIELLFHFCALFFCERQVKLFVLFNEHSQAAHRSYHNQNREHTAEVCNNLNTVDTDSGDHDIADCDDDGTPKGGQIFRGFRTVGRNSVGRDTGHRNEVRVASGNCG